MGRFSTALHGSFETLFFVQQHTFFNRFYFFQTFLQYMSFLELPINSDLSTVGFSWNEGILTPYARNTPCGATKACVFPPNPPAWHAGCT